MSDVERSCQIYTRRRQCDVISNSDLVGRKLCPAQATRLDALSISSLAPRLRPLFYPLGRRDATLTITRELRARNTLQSTLTLPAHPCLCSIRRSEGAERREKFKATNLHFAPLTLMPINAIPITFFPHALNHNLKVEKLLVKISPSQLCITIVHYNCKYVRLYSRINIDVVSTTKSRILTVIGISHHVAIDIIIDKLRVS